LRVIFDDIEEIEDDTGKQIELDVIAICCEHTEIDSEELMEEWGYLAKDSAPQLYQDNDQRPMTEIFSDSNLESYNEQRQKWEQDIFNALEDRTRVWKLENGNYLMENF
jgi:hypothetical protein